MDRPLSQSQASQDSQARVPAAAQVFGDYKLLVKILSRIPGIPGFPRSPNGLRVPFLVQLGGTCKGFRRAAGTLVDQRTIERFVTLMPTWQWVDFSASDGQVGPVGPYGPHEPDSGPDSSTITSRVRAVVRAQEPRWWVACPFRLHGLGGIARTSVLELRANKARRLLSLLSESRPEYSGLVGRLLDTKRPSVKAVESVEKLRELLLLDPEDPGNTVTEIYGTVNAYDIRGIKSLTGLELPHDADVTFWDTSHVTDMSSMAQTLGFRLKGIEHWNTARVMSMGNMFAWSTFNQDVGNWDVGRVETMAAMFMETPFNQDIGRWDTGSVKDMRGMFGLARVFDQDIGKWDVRQVSDMLRMFTGATAFDCDISAWAVGNVTSALDMLNSCPLREGHMPHTGLAVRGPRATELRPELTRIIGELGLSEMSVVCVDTATGPIRVTINKTMLTALASRTRAAREIRAKTQDKILRYVCGFYAAESSRGYVQFNWTAPLQRPHPWTCKPPTLCTVS
jgi:hypothetical protein